jgi:hypothetical protein
MTRVGFEPTKRNAVDLKSTPFGHLGILPILHARIELAYQPYKSRLFIQKMEQYT